MNSFKDKVVWVTGASSGIGLALVRQLNSEGAKIILSSRTRETLDSIMNELNGDHLVLPLDLSDMSNVREYVETVMTKYGRIDFLVNNGGMSQRALAGETSIDVDRRMMEVNYFGNIILTKAVLPIMQAQNEGKILVVSSIAGKFGFFLRSAYSAAKHALHGFYESLALEVEKDNIQVTIACPGKINTNISINALNASGEKHGEMDHNQATGMSAEQCALEMLLAVKKEKREVLIGNKEIKAVYLKRFFPKLFYKIIRKQSWT